MNELILIPGRVILVKKKKVALILTVILGIVALLSWYLYNHNIPVLNPAGEISQKQRQLIIIAVALCAIVVIPVYGLTIMIAFKYHENNNAKYSPDFDHNRMYETTWWAIPFVIITILSVITWRSSHSLDPYRTIASRNSAINVQVVALDWKWLFIYPDKNVASVNQMDIPVNHPVNLYITSDTVMNSFWVPSLAGQIYAMPGMSTQLHIIASKTGSFYGSSANISGQGFAGMHFAVNSVSDTNYNQWLSKVNSSNSKLNLAGYDKLAEPSINNKVAYYSGVSSSLFDYTVLKYMEPNVSGANI